MNAFIKPNALPKAFESGISLVEILVALAIGMIGVLVVFQTMVLWGGRTATTSQGLDMQTTGQVGMAYLERDLRQAGNGFSVTNAANRRLTANCSISTASTSQTNPLVVAALITTGSAPSGAGSSDTLRLLYGSADYPGVAEFKPDGSTYQSLQGVGFKNNDWVILANAGGCQFAQIASGTALVLDGNAANVARINQMTFKSSPAVAITAGNMFNLGQRPQWVEWSASSAGILQRTPWNFAGGSGGKGAAGTAVDVADGIVSLRAQYGLITPPATTVTWVDPPLNATQWPTLKAIRVALLLRNKKLERANEWNAPRPQWFGTDFDDDTLNPADGTAWQQYRYEVFEREIPLKNLIWGGQAQ